MAKELESKFHKKKKKYQKIVFKTSKIHNALNSVTVIP